MTNGRRLVLQSVVSVISMTIIAASNVAPFWKGVIIGITGGLMVAIVVDGVLDGWHQKEEKS